MSTGKDNTVLSPGKTKTPISSRRKLSIARNYSSLSGPIKRKSEQATPTSKKIKRTLDTVSHAPENWEQIYKGIKHMRTDTIAVDAPVDTMGASCLADVLDEDQAKTVRYQTLLGIMLSSRTKDQMTAKAIENLKSYFTSKNSILSLQSLLALPESQFDKLISCVGFHTQKTKYVYQTSKILLSKYSGDIPSDLAQLLTLPGIGPKMAHLALQCCWDKVDGICVDIHVHRISNRLGWAKSATPQGTESQLEKWVPRELWREINGLLVGFGQTVCSAKPNCGICEVKEWCPYGKDIEEVVTRNKRKTATSKGKGTRATKRIRKTSSDDDFEL